MKSLIAWIIVVLVVFACLVVALLWWYDQEVTQSETVEFVETVEVEPPTQKEVLEVLVPEEVIDGPAERAEAVDVLNVLVPEIEPSRDVNQEARVRSGTPTESLVPNTISEQEREEREAALDALISN